MTIMTNGWPGSKHATNYRFPPLDTICEMARGANLDRTRQDDEISDEDIRAALIEMKGYLDVTDSDLKKIYDIAMRHARERITTRIPVGKVMTTKVISVTDDADIFEAARSLSGNHISGMPVTDRNNRVIGVITETDILYSAGMGEHHSFKDILRHILGDPLPKRERSHIIRDAMSTPAVTTTSDTDVREAARLMSERRLKRLPVIDDEGRLIGIISKADVVRLIGSL